MSNLIIERVVTGRQKKEFLQFPWTLYRGDPNWIPPLRGDQKEILGYKPHPFHARNTIQTFVARRGNEVCGRIAAILNQGHIAQYNERRGFFGFFDCIDDQEVANGLFDAVRQWFADQDIHRLRGPMNPSMNYELGLLIDGFDSSPVFMMTYNPPYYERLVENYGFRKSQDLYAFWGQVSMLPAIAAKLTPISEQIIERYDVNVRSLDTTRFREDVESFLSIYNRSLVNTWGFVPMSQDEVRRMAAGLRHVIVPEMTVAVEIDGRMVGACFGLPDYNPRIREIDGRLFPFGFIHLLRNRRAIKRIRVISTNVLPEFQRMGLGLVLLSGLVPKALEWGLEEAEFSWVLESNRLSYGALKKGGAKITKTYRVYDLDEEQGSGEEGQSSGRNSSHALVATPLAPLAIREVKTRQDLDRFVRVPWRIYADDPHWVPPLLREVKAFLDRDKHPFYRHGEATTFLALRNEQPVGRVLVSDDVLYNKQSNLSVGCFGMFECLDDEEAARGLLDAASGWLRARGRKTMLGPIDYSLNYPCGLLIEGFETPPRIMMNHNRPYYGRLLESYGLRKAKDLDAWWFEDSRDLAGRWKTRAERLARRGRIVIRHFRMNEFAAEVGRCLEVYNATMADQWMYPKLTPAEFETFAKELARTAVPEQILLAEIDGRVVGLSITLPDVNEAIRPLNGRLTRYGLPLGLLRFFRERRRIKTARMAVLNVLPEFRRRGIAEMLILKTLEYGTAVLGYTGAELSWTFQDNRSVNHTIEGVGARRYKTYRLYEKEL